MWALWSSKSSEPRIFLIQPPQTGTQEYSAPSNWPIRASTPSSPNHRRIPNGTVCSHFPSKMSTRSCSFRFGVIREVIRPGRRFSTVEQRFVWRRLSINSRVGCRWRIKSCRRTCLGYFYWKWRPFIIPFARQWNLSRERNRIHHGRKPRFLWRYVQ